ncbi:hypothetical protein FQZ97_1036180 [compost metagenome]
MGFASLYAILRRACESIALQLGDHPVLRPQFIRQLARPTQAHRSALDIHQQRRAANRVQHRPVLQTPIGEDQHPLCFGRFLPLPARQPLGGLL